MGRQKIYTMTPFVMFLPFCSLIWCSDASEQISPSHPGLEWMGQPVEGQERPTSNGLSQ